MPWPLSHLGSGLRDCGLWEKQVPSYPRIPTWQLHRTRSEGTGGWVVVWVNGSLHLSMRSRKPAWTKPTPSGSQNLKRWRCEGRSSKERPRHTSRSHVPATEPSGKCSLRLRRYRGEAGVGCGRKRDHPPPGMRAAGPTQTSQHCGSPRGPAPGPASWRAELGRCPRGSRGSRCILLPEPRRKLGGPGSREAEFRHGAPGKASRCGPMDSSAVPLGAARPGGRKGPLPPTLSSGEPSQDS